MFTLELLQAINDWQKDGFGESKAILAEKIKKYSVELPLSFKTLDKVCYRKLDLKGHFIYEIGINFSVQETYSSWTFNSQIAEKFNGGIPTKESGKLGFIFELNPTQFSDFEVIINLYEVFQSKEFQQKCNDLQSRISDYYLGIGKYSNTEQEIILKVSELKIEQIWAYGSYPTPISVLTKKFNNQEFEPTEEQIRELEEILKAQGIDREQIWITKGKKPIKVQELIEKNKRYAQALLLKNRHL